MNNPIKTLAAIALLIPFSLTLASAGNQQSEEAFHSSRTARIQNYMAALRNHDAKQMLSQFVPGGTVVSTSQGNVDAASFFNSFFPEIQSAEVTINNIYIDRNSNSKASATFHFNWVLKDGSTGGGDYSDEFFFDDYSGSKLGKVIMYENLKA